MAAGPVAEPASAFGEGAHEVLARRVGESQSAEYRRVVGEFDAYLKRNPSDDVAAVERCRFMALFAYAEDFTIEGAAEDSEQCQAALEEGPLTDTAAVRLFLWQQEWGDETTQKGEALLADSANWTRGQRAALHEALAGRYRHSDLLKSGAHALSAVELNPASHQRLWAAEHLTRMGAKRRAVAMIQGTPAEGWQAWTLRAAVVALVGMGEAPAALELVQAHEDLQIDGPTRASLSRALFAAGRVDESQRLMKALLEDTQKAPAFRHALERELYEFHRDHGERADAIAAYRKLRDSGYSADPLGYYRLSLSARYPDAPWAAADFLGVAALLALFGFLALLPLIVVVPLHYWSLARRARGVMPAEPTPASPWNLGQLWYALATVLLAGSVSLYVFCYPLFESYFAAALPQGMSRDGPADERALAHAFVLGEVLCALALLVLLRGTRPRQLLLGQWSVGKSLLAGLAWSFMILFANRMLLAATKAGADPGIALGSDTIRAMQGVHALYGAGGLLLTAALLTPVTEELVFRGVFLRAAARHVRFWIAAVVQALVFVALHDQPGAYPLLFLLATGGAWLALRSGGLLAPIALHATNNAVAVLAVMGITRALNAAP